METVNKIQIRLDKISTTASTITVPFGLDFLPVDNTELQETEFIEKEKEKAINPIFDNEKYPFYPRFNGVGGVDVNSFIVEYLTNLTLDKLDLTYEDIFFNRNPFRKTYLRLNFYDSRDSKVQRLVHRETLHLKINDSWFLNGDLRPLNTIFASFVGNFQNLIYGSPNGEGYQLYWHKNNLPYTLYIKPTIMNAKTGNAMRLYSSNIAFFPPPSLPVAIESGGYGYVQCDFYSDFTSRQKYYYKLNGDGLSNINTQEDSFFPTNNKITVNLTHY